VVLREGATGKRIPNEAYRIGSIQIAVDAVVQSKGGRLIAATEAGDVSDRRIFGALSPKGLLQFCLLVRDHHADGRSCPRKPHFRTGRRR